MNMKKSMLYLSLSASLLAGGVLGQLAGTATEVQPAITVQECSALNSCKTISTSVTIDANWRWAHTSSGTNCYTGNNWNPAICADPVACANNCVLEGASTQEYKGTYGVSTSGSELNLGFVTVGPYSTNVGSRVYLMENTDTYQLFKLLNKEFTIDVDSSELDCGLNGALYFVEMAADGGKSAYAGNKAGAKFGTGYCDAQCPHDVKFINGEANSVDWVPSPEDPNSGKGRYGTCCPEMDIWEANKISTAFTPHPCSVSGQTRCVGNDCGDGDNRYGGLCDKDGCDFNSYRMGNKTFYGPGMNVDSTKPITVVTQFITDDGTDNGDLVEIRRIYKQNGKVIHNSGATYPAIKGANSLTDGICAAQKSLFGDSDDFAEKGGMKEMGESLKRGMVLAMSLWVDYDAHCLWLDGSAFPTTSDPSKPGVARGSCPSTSGNPRDVIASAPKSTVSYGNIKWGPIGSTTDTGSEPTSAPTQKPTNPPTQRPTNPPTVAPTNPPTQKPTQKPTEAPTVAPTNPPTQKPTDAPTNAPTEAPTDAPTETPTDAPTESPSVTEAPTAPPHGGCFPPSSTVSPTESATVSPTQPSGPTDAPVDCAASVSIVSTKTGGWNDGTNEYSQWSVTVTPSVSLHSLNLATTSPLTSVWQLNKEEDGTYTLGDWRLAANQPIPAGDSFTFGYIAQGSEEVIFTKEMVSCGSDSDSQSRRSIKNNDLHDVDSSASSSSYFSYGVSAAVALGALIYTIL